ncbi:MAG: hypothetical protein LBF93_12275 [Zoogloeaceae bacterium]|jgi:hypothetical protein|nr:hypothetical protein [Zoogloeaceae bacterium]
MKRLFSLFLCLSFPLFALPCAAAADFASEEDFAQWLVGYHRRPEPARLSGAFHYAATSGWLGGPGLFSGVFSGFLAGVFRDNPEKVPGWQTEWSTLGKAVADKEEDDAEDDAEDGEAMAGREAIVFFALWYAERPDLRQMARAMREKNENVKSLAHMNVKLLAHMIQNYHDDARSLEEIPLNQGEWVVSALWGKFYATGEVTALERTLQALPWEENPALAEYGNQPLGVIFAPQWIGRTAHWMLSDAAYLDPRMLELCETFLEQTRDTAIAEALRGIVAEVKKAKAAAKK